MTVSAPHDLAEALGLLAERPDTQILAGGTDFMVEVNFGHRRPIDVVVVRALPELRGWEKNDGMVTLRAGLTYTEMQQAPLADLVPALAQAARTVGSPQIRNAGTLGGNLGTASPAGDTLPVLSALDARIRVRSATATRELSLDDFHVGPKQHNLGPDELVTEVILPAARGTQEFLKVGTRNAMVISVCSVALVLDRADQSVSCAIGAAGPVIIRARDAEAWIAERIDWSDRRLDEDLAVEFGRRVADAARPIDDHRSRAEYRRHAVGVLAARALRRAL